MVLESLLRVFVLLFLPCHCQTGQILPPRNVSAVWSKGDFEPGLSWLPPHHSTPNCHYELSFITKNKREGVKTKKSPWYYYFAMEGGFIQWSISTVCGEIKSAAVVLNVSYPEIVKQFKCYLFATNQSRCEWLPNFNPPDLKFYYDLVNQCRTESTSARLVECSSYIYNDSMKIGCDIQATDCHTLYVLFNGTLNDKPVKNTFLRRLQEDLRPPPLTVTATKNGSKINISWIEPDIIPKNWRIRLNYTECDAVRELIRLNDKKPFLLDWVPHCQYSISIRAEGRWGKTPWSDRKYFDAEHDSNMNLYTSTLIPILFGLLSAFTCVCCQQNKRLIFPKVPHPADFLSDIVDDKFAISHVNILAKEEEEECIITLVTDPPKLAAEC